MAGDAGMSNLESELLPEQMLGSDLLRGGIFLIEACTAKDHDIQLSVWRLIFQVLSFSSLHV